MRLPRFPSLLAASLSLAALAAAGCGSSSKSSSTTSATSTTPLATAPTTTSTATKHAATTTNTGSARTTTPGSSSGGAGLPTLAKKPHLGDACDVKDEAAYVIAGFTCLQGHLTSSGAGNTPLYSAGQFCKPGDAVLYDHYNLTCVKGILRRK